MQRGIHSNNKCFRGEKMQYCAIHNQDYMDHVLSCPVCTGEQLGAIWEHRSMREGGRTLTDSDFFECPKGWGFGEYWFCKEVRAVSWKRECGDCKEWQRHAVPDDSKPSRFKRECEELRTTMTEVFDIPASLLKPVSPDNAKPSRFKRSSNNDSKPTKRSRFIRRT